jgi:competence protein ComEC
MALFAGGAYWLFRLTFSTFGAYGRIHDPRKPAALAAIFVASLYLVLSGAAVPTQRAWIMTIVVLVGVMLDRRAFTFQSLSIAALIVLAIAPQSVVEVGFQMSFAAVAALIAVYEMIMRSRANTVPMQSAFRHVRMGLEGLVVTSLVAGAATGVFAGFHFQRMAAFGFFANLAAMPIFTFWVMPAGAMALILMPFSMEGVALSIMAPGLDLILQIAHCASSADGARVDLAAPNPVLITIFAFGFALASLGLGATRLVGSAVCLSVLAAWALQSSPELMVTDGGIVIVHESQTDRYQISSMRGRFDRRVMIQRAGGGLAQPERLSAQCDRLGCIGTTEDGLSFAITDRPEALEEDCQNVALIVFRGTLTNWQKRRCQALVLDDTKRSEDGGLEFWIQDQMLSRFRSVRRSRGQRLWTQ